MSGDTEPAEEGKAPITPAELRSLIASLLAGAAGGSEERWAKLVGEVEQLPIAFNIHCNWRIAPTGPRKDRDAIEQAVELVRTANPYVHGEPSTE